MKCNIEAERSRLGLTQEAAAKLLGVSPKTYAGYVNGKKIPSSVLIKMAYLFHCSTDYLLGLDNPPTQHDPAA